MRLLTAEERESLFRACTILSDIGKVRAAILICDAIDTDNQNRRLENLCDGDLLKLVASISHDSPPCQVHSGVAVDHLPEGLGDRGGCQE